jgi:ABC-type multidrug transport system permease subunit
MSNFSLYLIGIVVLIMGLVYGAHLLGVPHMWIAVGVLILLGLGIATGVTRTRRREPSDMEAR